MTNTNQFKEVDERFVEKGAALEHERWSRWQGWVHGLAVKNSDGSLTIPAESVERWNRQIDTPYDKLSEKEKESDREQVRDYLPLLHTELLNERKRVLQEVLEGLPEKESKTNPQTGMKYYKDYNRGMVMGFNNCLSQIKASITKQLEK